MIIGYLINITSKATGTLFQLAGRRPAFSSDIAKDAMQKGCDGLYAMVNRVEKEYLYRLSDVKTE